MYPAALLSVSGHRLARTGRTLIWKSPFFPGSALTAERVNFLSDKPAEREADEHRYAAPGTAPVRPPHAPTNEQDSSVHRNHVGSFARPALIEQVYGRPEPRHLDQIPEPWDERNAVFCGIRNRTAYKNRLLAVSMAEKFCSILFLIVFFKASEAIAIPPPGGTISPSTKFSGIRVHWSNTITFTGQVRGRPRAFTLGDGRNFFHRLLVWHRDGRAADSPPKCQNSLPIAETPSLPRPEFCASGTARAPKTLQCRPGSGLRGRGLPIPDQTGAGQTG